MSGLSKKVTQLEDSVHVGASGAESSQKGGCILKLSDALELSESPAPDASGPLDEEMRPFRYVRIRGLVDRPDLDGRVAMLQNWLPETQQWSCITTATEESTAIPSEHLVPISMHEALEEASDSSTNSHTDALSGPTVSASLPGVGASLAAPPAWSH